MASATSTDSSSESESDDYPTDFKRRRIDKPVESACDSTETSQSSDDNHNNAMQEIQSLGNYSSAASKMMMKMGYKAGTGLGKEGQGRVDIVPASQQRGRRGLGLKIKALDKDIVVHWDDGKEPSVEEEVEWMTPYEEQFPDAEEMRDWYTAGKKKLIIEDETLFCSKDLLHTMLQCKSIFDDLEGPEMRNARMRSNPFETIKGVIFLNRAAMKMANMDHCFDYMFTSPKNLQSNEQLYFADVCAGPGGFSEYILWRKKWRSKGFGFTLKGNNDFKLGQFYAANSEFFEPVYGVGGVDGDGDIMKSENLDEFQDFVLRSTDGEGVHFVMADGGFSVEGQENLQEILTKQLLLCQFACALSILRQGGNFVCKTFDLFTPFSVGLCYLLRIAFERICIFKPVTSRPANSERYVVCEGYRDDSRQVFDYMISINDMLNEFKASSPGDDIIEVVPMEILLGDAQFVKYMKTSNERIADEQCKALAKIHDFSKDRNLMEMKQHDIRLECLQKWGIPNEVRAAPPRTDAASVFHKFTGLDNPGELPGASSELKAENLEQKLGKVHNFKCYLSGGRSSIIVGLGGMYTSFWNERMKKWSNLTQVNCKIPRNTILEVEIVQELKGEGKGQHRVYSLHAVDALVLAGDDIRKRNYTDRMQCLSMLVNAVSKPSCPNLNVIRAKPIYRLDNIKEIFKYGLEMKRVKGHGANPVVCCELPDSGSCFVPTGVTFVNVAREPWSMEFSKSQKKHYFYNQHTQKSVFECPPDFNATYEVCKGTRVHWLWNENVKIHQDQMVTHRPSFVSRDQILDFVNKRCPH